MQRLDRDLTPIVEYQVENNMMSEICLLLLGWGMRWKLGLYKR